MSNGSNINEFEYITTVEFTLGLKNLRVLSILSNDPVITTVSAISTLTSQVTHQSG